MAEDRIGEAVSHFERCLRESGIKVSKIILFGSHAKGTATEGSDIDVAVISEDFQGKDVFERARITKEAEIDTIRIFLVPLDILTLTPEEAESGASPVSE
jgi:predicted nucleotidyltransferase